MPSFVFLRRRISVLTHARLQEARSKSKTLSAAIDEINSDLGEEFYLPISTASVAFRFAPQRPP